MKYLGETFDIHTGGIDHIPVHHNNEIAQSEHATDKSFAHYWMHNAFVTIGDAKMAKSADNFLILKSLNYSPLAYRYFLLNGRYSTPLNFEISWLDQFASGLRNLKEEIKELEIRSKGKKIKNDPRPLEIVADDLNTSGVIAEMWKIIKSDTSPEEKIGFIKSADAILGLDLFSPLPKLTIPKEVLDLSKERDNARAVKDWKKSDQLRLEIEKYGFEVLDSEKETVIRPKI